jgi:hypothetical protein
MTQPAKQAALAAVTRMYASLNDSDKWHKDFGTVKAALNSEQATAGDGWIKITSMDDLPKKQTTSYEQYDCHVFHKGVVKHLVWNCEHEVWDDHSGDDYYCDPLEPTHYMMFPEEPLTAEQATAGDEVMPHILDTLKEMADQMTVDEMFENDCESADFEYAYNMLVMKAREVYFALTPQSDAGEVDHD